MEPSSNPPESHKPFPPLKSARSQKQTYKDHQDIMEQHSSRSREVCSFVSVFRHRQNCRREGLRLYDYLQRVDPTISWKKGRGTFATYHFITSTRHVPSRWSLHRR